MFDLLISAVFSVWSFLGPAWFTAASLLSLYLLWILYVFSMFILRVREQGKLPTASFVLALPVVSFAALWDWFCNFFICTIYFQDPPGGWSLWWRQFTAFSWDEIKGALLELVTGRLKRYKRSGLYVKRAALSSWIGKNLLDPLNNEEGVPHV